MKSPFLNKFWSAEYLAHKAHELILLQKKKKKKKKKKLFHGFHNYA